ncbi:protein prenyltransferase alpha subunit repeat-containing protein 1 isoform X2 [Toxorhynchites rutilus septentrionalis]|nr:protein prenyltransferase alpha subunit repeat-containing protein 1 isoform X2 [Toxorhynchites rutilus septentrionalis]XP_055638483.1 protein prenyltransferase alpha subunit repeat-containing protein 1 isoform X2 [Toxorhynchites rutilus septentrionalis]
MSLLEAVNLDDSNAFCEKIINEIHSVFLNDTELSGFEIIPMPSNTNKSPVIHVEHNLGLQSWCVKYIYEYSHRTILRHKSDYQKISGGSVPASGAANSSGHCSLLMTGNGSNSIVKYLNCAILINPDVATFWNLRRQLFAKNRLDITKEFQFSTVVLSKKPKSNEAFAYRRWLYLFQSYDAIDWSFEIALCEKCADKSTTNYHAWCHRQWVVMKAPYLLKFEIHKTEKFIRKHVHDYSCYNYRQFVLAKMQERLHFDDDEGSHFNELLRYVNALVDTPMETVEELLRWLAPGVCKDKTVDIKLRSFLFCLNVAANDLMMCEELKSLHGESQAFENHRRYMTRFIVDRCRSASCTLTREMGGQMSSCTQPMNKITKLDEQDSLFVQTMIQNEKNREHPQHQKWCELFLEG